MRSVRHQVDGARFAIAAPHPSASFLGLRAAVAGAEVSEAALTGALSSMLNLPHLCGIGGDAMILQRDHGHGIHGFNGSGCTGGGHTIDRITSARASAGRRGLPNALVYGAPSAFEGFSKFNDCDLGRVVASVKEDLDRPDLPPDVYTSEFLKSHSSELAAARLPEVFRRLTSKGEVHHPSGTLLEAIAEGGFATCYHGEVGGAVERFAIDHSAGIFRKGDFTSFEPARSEIFTISAMGAEISMMGINTPWLELSCLLRLLERWAREGFKLDAQGVQRLCRAAGEIDAYIEQLNLPRETQWESNRDLLLDRFVDRVDGLVHEKRIIPVTSKGSDTVFLAVADARGNVCGISSSIFTPFGSLIDPIENGLVLSNRAASFSLDEQNWNALRPLAYPAHTTNAVLCESLDLRFCLGTSGGPVQSQVLAQVLYLILQDGLPPQVALERGRTANMGFSRKHDRVVFLTDNPELKEDCRFTFERSYSQKLGVTQIAGFNKRSGCVFSAADPRGGGCALSI